MKNKILIKSLSIVVLCAFLFNDLAYGLSPIVVSGPDGGGSGTRDDMYALGKKLFAAKWLGPGSIGAMDMSRVGIPKFRGTAPKIKNVSNFRRVTYREDMEFPAGWSNNKVNRELLKSRDLISALRCFRKNEAAISGEFLSIEEGYFEPERKGELPIARTEILDNGMLKLIVHTEFVQMWDDLLARDIWFDHTFPDGKTRTVSAAWALFYRLAKHEMADRVKVGAYHKGGGHISSFSFGSIPEIFSNEFSANEIGGRYNIINDAIWLWYLGSYSYTNKTRYNNRTAKARYNWIFNGKKAKELELDQEFPNLRGGENKANREFAIKLALNINKTCFEKGRIVWETVVDQKFIDAYERRRQRIYSVLPATGRDDDRKPRAHDRWARGEAGPAKKDLAAASVDDITALLRKYGLKPATISEREWIASVASMLCVEAGFSKIAPLVNKLCLVQDLGRYIEDTEPELYGRVKAAFKKHGLETTADALIDAAKEAGFTDMMDFARNVIGGEIEWNPKTEEAARGLADHENRTLELLEDEGYSIGQFEVNLIPAHHDFSKLSTETTPVKRAITAAIRLALILNYSNRNKGDSMEAVESFMVSRINTEGMAGYGIDAMQNYRRLLAAEGGQLLARIREARAAYSADSVIREGDAEFLASLQGRLMSGEPPVAGAGSDGSVIEGKLTIGDLNRAVIREINSDSGITVSDAEGYIELWGNFIAEHAAENTTVNISDIENILASKGEETIGWRESIRALITPLSVGIGIVWGYTGFWYIAAMHYVAGAVFFGDFIYNNFIKGKDEKEGFAALAGYLRKAKLGVPGQAVTFFAIGTPSVTPKATLANLTIDALTGEITKALKHDFSLTIWDRFRYGELWGKVIEKYGENAAISISNIEKGLINKRSRLIGWCGAGIAAGCVFGAAGVLCGIAVPWATALFDLITVYYSIEGIFGLVGTRQQDLAALAGYLKKIEYELRSQEAGEAVETPAQPQRDDKHSPGEPPTAGSIDGVKPSDLAIHPMLNALINKYLQGGNGNACVSEDIKTPFFDKLYLLGDANDFTFRDIFDKLVNREMREQHMNRPDAEAALVIQLVNHYRSYAHINRHMVEAFKNQLAQQVEHFGVYHNGAIYVMRGLIGSKDEIIQHAVLECRIHRECAESLDYNGQGAESAYRSWRDPIDSREMDVNVAIPEHGINIRGRMTYKRFVDLAYDAAEKAYPLSSLIPKNKRHKLGDLSYALPGEPPVAGVGSDGAGAESKLTIDDLTRAVIRSINDDPSLTESVIEGYVDLWNDFIQERPEDNATVNISDIKKALAEKNEQLTPLAGVVIEATTAAIFFAVGVIWSITGPWYVAAIYYAISTGFLADSINNYLSHHKQKDFMALAGYLKKIEYELRSQEAGEAVETPARMPEETDRRIKRGKSPDWALTVIALSGLEEITIKDYLDQFDWAIEEYPEFDLDVRAEKKPESTARRDLYLNPRSLEIMGIIEPASRLPGSREYRWRLTEKGRRLAELTVRMRKKIEEAWQIVPSGIRCDGTTSEELIIVEDDKKVLESELKSLLRLNGRDLAQKLAAARLEDRCEIDDILRDLSGNARVSEKLRTCIEDAKAAAAEFNKVTSMLEPRKAGVKRREPPTMQEKLEPEEFFAQNRTKNAEPIKPMSSLPYSHDDNIRFMSQTGKERQLAPQNSAEPARISVGGSEKTEAISVPSLADIRNISSAFAARLPSNFPDSFRTRRDLRLWMLNDIQSLRAQFLENMARAGGYKKTDVMYPQYSGWAIECDNKRSEAERVYGILFGEGEAKPARPRDNARFDYKSPGSPAHYLLYIGLYPPIPTGWKPRTLTSAHFSQMGKISDRTLRRDRKFLEDIGYLDIEKPTWLTEKGYAEACDFAGRLKTLAAQVKPGYSGDSRLLVQDLIKEANPQILSEIKKMNDKLRAEAKSVRLSKADQRKRLAAILSAAKIKDLTARVTALIYLRDNLPRETKREDEKLKRSIVEIAGQNDNLAARVTALAYLRDVLPSRTEIESEKLWQSICAIATQKKDLTARVMALIYMRDEYDPDIDADKRQEKLWNSIGKIARQKKDLTARVTALMFLKSPDRWVQHEFSRLAPDGELLYFYRDSDRRRASPIREIANQDKDLTARVAALICLRNGGDYNCEELWQSIRRIAHQKRDPVARVTALIYMRDNTPEIAGDERERLLQRIQGKEPASVSVPRFDWVDTLSRAERKEIVDNLALTDEQIADRTILRAAIAAVTANTEQDKKQAMIVLACRFQELDGDGSYAAAERAEQSIKDIRREIDNKGEIDRRTESGKGQAAETPARPRDGNDRSWNGHITEGDIRMHADVGNSEDINWLVDASANQPDMVEKILTEPKYAAVRKQYKVALAKLPSMQWGIKDFTSMAQFLGKHAASFKKQVGGFHFYIGVPEHSDQRSLKTSFISYNANFGKGMSYTFRKEPSGEISLIVNRAICDGMGESHIFTINENMIREEYGSRAEVIENGLIKGFVSKDGCLYVLVSHAGKEFAKNYIPEFDPEYKFVSFVESMPGTVVTTPVLETDVAKTAQAATGVSADAQEVTQPEAEDLENLHYYWLALGAAQREAIIENIAEVTLRRVSYADTDLLYSVAARVGAKMPNEINQAMAMIVRCFKSRGKDDTAAQKTAEELVELVNTALNAIKTLPEQRIRFQSALDGARNRLTAEQMGVRFPVAQPAVNEKPQAAAISDTATELVELMAKRDALPESADLLVVFGSPDAEMVAAEAAKMYRERKISRILVSGKYGKHCTPCADNGDFGRDKDGNIVRAEALIMRDAIIAAGVPESSILVEKESQGMTDNGVFSVNKLIEANIVPKTVIFMHAPLMQLRGSLALRNALAQNKIEAAVYDYAASIPVNPSEKLSAIIWQAGRLDIEIEPIVGKERYAQIILLLESLRMPEKSAGEQSATGMNMPVANEVNVAEAKPAQPAVRAGGRANNLIEISELNQHIVELEAMASRGKYVADELAVAHERLLALAKAAAVNAQEVTQPAAQEAENASVAQPTLEELTVEMSSGATAVDWMPVWENVLQMVLSKKVYGSAVTIREYMECNDVDRETTVTALSELVRQGYLVRSNIIRWSYDLTPKAAVEILCAQAIAEQGLDTDEFWSARAAAIKDTKNRAIIKAISDFTARQGPNAGPGAMIPLSKTTTLSIWQIVNLAHQNRIEIFRPQEDGRSAGMKKALDTIEKRRGDIISDRFYTGNNLEAMLRDPAKKGTLRIVLTTNAESKRLVEALSRKDVTLFKSTRLLNLTLPREYSAYLPNSKERTYYQAKMIFEAILARLYEKGKTPMVELIMRSVFEGRIDGGMDKFLETLAEAEDEKDNPDPEKIKIRIENCLNIIVRLSEEVARSIEHLKLIMKEFWTAA
ncbi:MAG: hypothetical protein WC522_00720 [Candidatus Omnitrophota bacterium]